MVKVFVVSGLALLAGGAYAIVDGWPYRVLEQGFTEVILGGLSVAAGLLMLAAAAILAEIRRLKTMLVDALSSSKLGRRDEPVLAGTPAPSLSEAPALRQAPVPTPEFGVGAAAAGAGAIVLGGALTSLIRPSEPADDGENAADAGAPLAAPVTEPEEAAVPTADLAAELAKAEAEAELAHDDWLLPPAPAPHLAAASDPAAQAGSTRGSEPDFFEAALLPTPPDMAPAEVVGAPEPESLPEPEPEIEAHPELALEPHPEPEPKPDAEAERIWWPRLDRPGEAEARAAEATPEPDDFSALREQLTDALGKPGAAPEVEPPRRSLEAASDWMSPRPWPPVTQPRSEDVLDDLDEPVAASDDASDIAEEVAPPLPEVASDAAAPSPAIEAGPAAAHEPEEAEFPSEPQPEEPEEAATVPAAPEPEAPAASDEGIVGAYQVGETHFTIYADGSIQARTPDGDYVFASMDELKAYLASEKNRLEPGSN